MRHRALRIVFGNLSEGGLCRLKRERVQQSDSAFKLLLNCRRTGDWKMDCTQLLLRRAMLMVLFWESGDGGDTSQKEQYG